MNAADAKFQFPVLCFTQEPDLWGATDLDILTSCSRSALSEEVQTGMEIVDGKLRRFRVKSFKRTGYARPFPMWLIGMLLSGGLHRVEHDLEPLTPLTLDELKARIRPIIEATPENFADTGDLAKDIPRLLAKVASAKTVRRLHDLAVVDDFRGY